MRLSRIIRSLDLTAETIRRQKAPGGAFGDRDESLPARPFIHHTHGSSTQFPHDHWCCVVVHTCRDTNWEPCFLVWLSHRCY